MKFSKQIILTIAVFACLLFALVFFRFESSESRVAALSYPQVEKEIALLESQIIPPDGTALEDVEAVYGATAGSGKGAPFDWRAIEVVPIKSKRPTFFGPKVGTYYNLDFRVVAGRVEGVALAERQWPPVSGLKQIGLGILQYSDSTEAKLTPQEKLQIKLQREEIERKDRERLEALMDIQRRFGKWINGAAWNR